MIPYDDAFTVFFSKHSGFVHRGAGLFFQHFWFGWLCNKVDQFNEIMIIYLFQYSIVRSTPYVISIKVFAQFRCLVHISVYDSDVDLDKITYSTHSQKLVHSFIQFSS